MTKYSRFFVTLAVILTAAISTIGCGRSATPAPANNSADAVVNITGCGSKAAATATTNNWFAPNARASAVAENAPCPPKKVRKPKPAPTPTPAPVKPVAPKPQVRATPRAPVQFNFSGSVEEYGQLIDSLRGNKEDGVFSQESAPPVPPVPPMPPATGTPPRIIFPPKVGPGGISNPEPPPPARHFLTPAERAARDRADYDRAMLAARERLATMGHAQGS